MYVNEMDCCGLAQADEMVAHRSAADKFQSFIGEVSHRYADKRFDHFGALVMTEAGRRSTYVRRFVAFIRERNLGVVTENPTFTNPNTGRPIRVFIWNIDWKAVHAYCLKEKIDLYDFKDWYAGEKNGQRYIPGRARPEAPQADDRYQFTGEGLFP